MLEQAIIVAIISILIMKTWRMIWKIISLILLWTIVLVSAAAVAAKVIDMNVFHTLSEMTEDCSFAEELENAVMTKNIPSSMPTPEDNVIRNEELSNIYKSLSKLPRKDINIFMMKTYDDYRISEISRKHTLTPSRVETSLQNTVMSVRKDFIRKGLM